MEKGPPSIFLQQAAHAFLALAPCPPPHHSLTRPLFPPTHAQVAHGAVTKTGEAVAATGDKIKASAPDPAAAPAEGGIPAERAEGVPPGPGEGPLEGAGPTPRLGE